jgi:hypothetical protein
MIESTKGICNSNRCPLTSFPQIMVWFKGILKSRLFQILRSMADLLVRVGVYVSDVDLRKWETAIDLRIWKKDIYLRYRCLWRRNLTWIWELDVDLSLAYLQSDDDYTRWNTILLLRIPLNQTMIWGNDVSGHRFESGRWSESIKYNNSLMCFSVKRPVWSKLLEKLDADMPYI